MRRLTSVKVMKITTISVMIGTSRLTRCLSVGATFLGSSLLKFRVGVEEKGDGSASGSLY